MNKPEPSIRVNVDVTNPGQFFACCGLLELADRLWPGAEGWFEDGVFLIACEHSLSELVQAICAAKLEQVDLENNTSSPINIGEPFPPLTLDWWHDELAGGKEMKVWAGTMESYRIAAAMQLAMNRPDFQQQQLLDIGLVAYDPEDTEKKVEPYYFDARRGPNAHSRDVGFSPNTLQLTTTAFPAVELLCLIGLQRCLPAETKQARIFDYFTWAIPVAATLLPAVVTGQIQYSTTKRYRFENWYRTGQKKHKAFRSANQISLGEDK